MEAESHSTSPLLVTLLEGPVIRGVGLGHHQLRFDEYVVELTPPGTPRMPNGIECRLSVRAGSRAAIGKGSLVVGRAEIVPGPGWNPIPVFAPIRCLPPGLPPRWMDGAGTVVMAGYLAGIVLLHGQRSRAQELSQRPIKSTGPAGATLLRHAARGEVPEPVHELLAARGASRLVSSSIVGVAWLRGLVSAGLPIDVATLRVAETRRSA